MARARKRILGVGIATLDIINQLAEYPPEDAEVRAVTHYRARGGNAANSLAVLAQYGHHSHWCGTLADDASSDWIRAELVRQGITIMLDTRCANTTTPTSYIVLSQASGSRTIVHYRDLPELDAVTFNSVALADFDWVHFEGRQPRETAQMLARVRTACPTAQISVELEKPRPDLELLFDGPDGLLISRAYAQALGFQQPQAFLHDLAARTSAAWLVLGWGAAGAYYWTAAGECGAVPAYQPDQILDTLGAGDCLNAAVIDGQLRGLDLATTVARAVRLAGFKCGYRGFDGVVNAAESVM